MASLEPKVLANMAPEYPKIPLKWNAKPTILTIRYLVRYLVGYLVKYQIIVIFNCERLILFCSFKTFFHSLKVFVGRKPNWEMFFSAIEKKPSGGLPQR